LLRGKARIATATKIARAVTRDDHHLRPRSDVTPLATHLAARGASSPTAT
jgi:hypothetical protein